MRENAKLRWLEPIDATEEGYLVSEKVPVPSGATVAEYFLCPPKGVAALTFYGENGTVCLETEGEIRDTDGAVNGAVEIPKNAAFASVSASQGFARSALSFTDRALKNTEFRPRVPLTVLCIGDSLTEGDYGGIPNVANVQTLNYPRYLAETLGVTTKNYGKCGYTAAQAYAWYKGGAYSAKEGDLALVMLGTNWGLSLGDGSNLSAYRALIADMRAENPALKVVLCAPPHATENPDKVNFGYAPNAENAAKEVRKIAEEWGLFLIDVYGESDFNADSEDVYQSRDGLHFGRLGYERLAAFFAEKLAKLFPELFSLLKG